MIMICRLLVRVASISLFPGPPSLLRSASYDNNACRAQNVEIATLALYLPNKLGPKKRLKTRKQLKVEQTMCHVVVLVVIGTSA